MLADRIYQCGERDVLYHYCSAATFQAIASLGTIRFTDINMLNDASEMRLAYSVFEEAADRLIKRDGIAPTAPAIPIEFFDSVDSIVAPSQLIAHPFIACFSDQPDILGQWRAYADDGRGYAVGFSALDLQRALPATFLRVLYQREDQVKEMMHALLAIFLRQQSKDQVVREKFLEDCILLSAFMTAFKHPAFIEEQEIRAVHVVNVEPKGKLLKFVDAGGIVHGDVATSGNEIKFQVRDNHLTAYFDHQFAALGTDTPMKELMIGPKNYSAHGNLALFLGGLGYEDMTLKASGAPYR